MSEDLQRDLGERRLDLELAEALGGAAPPDCTAAVAARLRAGPVRRWPSPKLAAAVAAAALMAVAWFWWRSAGTAGPAAVPPVAAGPLAAPREQPPRHESAADVAARRSADAMLAAEARLAARLAAGELAGAERLPFAALTGWPYTQGLAGAPAAVRALDGRQVLMVGFMLPIDEVRGMRHFLLVESLWSCCYGTPPDVHGLVRVVLPAGRTTEWTAEPLRVRGTLRVGETREDGYVVDVFQLQADEVAPIQ